MEKLFNDIPVSESEIKAERTRFLREYAGNVGWDADNLTESQLDVIKRQAGYKAAGMVRS